MGIETALSRWIGPFDRPWHWIVFSIFCLGLDYLTGPVTRFPVIFVLPVTFAAWHRGLSWAFPLALILSAALFGINHLEQPEESWLAGLENAFVRVFVLGILAMLVDAVARQYRALEQEVQVLSGLLPICSYCKKIRDEGEQWQRIERYIAAHSAASFTHSICPECEVKYFPEDEAP